MLEQILSPFPNRDRITAFEDPRIVVMIRPLHPVTVPPEVLHQELVDQLGTGIAPGTPSPSGAGSGSIVVVIVIPAVVVQSLLLVLMKVVMMRHAPSSLINLITIK